MLPPPVSTIAAVIRHAVRRLFGRRARPEPDRSAAGWPPPAPVVAQARSTAAVRRRVRRALLPPIPPTQARRIRADLAHLLDHWPGGRRCQPSLALIERAVLKEGGRGIDGIPACVLRHAARSVDFLDPVQLSPGLVELRRRVAQLLRRQHGGDRRGAMEADARPQAPAPDFEDSLTEFIELDALVGECAP